jgi:hypothetical protein
LLERKTIGAPLFPKGAAFVLGGGCLLVCLLVLFGCGMNPDDKLGDGLNGDIGEDCIIDACDDIWCTEDNDLTCNTRWCIGKIDDQYCSSQCDIDGECPVGYTCTEECSLKVSASQLCVTNEDFSFLQEIKYCP